MHKEKATSGIDSTTERPVGFDEARTYSQLWIWP